MNILYTPSDFQHLFGACEGITASGVSIDTRTVQPGDLFIALQTGSGDGHAHVAAALAKGAAGVLVHRDLGLPHCIRVADTLVGLGVLARFARARFGGKLVAVTGSVGKTTTKEMLRAVLSASGRTHAAEASYNNHWGVPLTLARMRPDDDFAVIEIGMNHPGEIAPLALLARPHVAVITAIATAHIGHMGSIEAIALEKVSIAQGLLPGGSIVLPADCAQAALLESHSLEARIAWFGAENLRTAGEGPRGSSILANICGEHIHFQLPVPGRHMVMNALAALTASHFLGADMRLGAACLADFHGVAGRGVQRSLLGGEATLLDESYNASPASVRAALAVLKMMPAQRRVAVLGDMLELGDFSRDEHTSLAGCVGESADMLYACGVYSQYLFDAVPRHQQGAHAQNSQALAPLVAAALRPGDAVLVKGSLGSRMKTIVDQLTGLAAVGTA